jgi:fumarate reductase flavoprotein subunit
MILRDFDVIVVGGGGAGLSAAITAAAAGRRVILLEKGRDLGGSTRLSVGSFSAAGTSLQHRAGIVDTAEQFTRDLIESNGSLEAHENPILREVLVRGAAASFEWLREFGVEFFGPTPEQAFTHARMHNVVPNSRAYIYALQREAVRRGVEISVNTPVYSLIQDQRGAVIGVRAGRDTWRARSVVLASGDYSGSRDFKRKWISEQTSRLPPLNPVNTGDGFTMGLAVGGAAVNTWRALEELRLLPPRRAELIKRIPPVAPVSKGMKWAIEHLPRSVVAEVARWALTGWVSPSRELFERGAILVNGHGNRFTDELGNAARALADQPENACFIVFDATVAEEFSEWPHPISTFPGIAYAYLRDYARIRPDAYHQAGTLDELGRKLGLPAASLRATASKYNAFVGGLADEFGRPRFGRGLHHAPFVALGPLRGVVTITDGGLVVDDQCRVLRGDTPVDGLFAAGATGQGGLILKAHGLHIAWAVTSGRVSGHAAVGEG